MESNMKFDKHKRLSEEKQIDMHWEQQKKAKKKMMWEKRNSSYPVLLT